MKGSCRLGVVCCNHKFIILQKLSSDLLRPASGFIAAAEAPHSQTLIRCLLLPVRSSAHLHRSLHARAHTPSCVHGFSNDRRRRSAVCR
eukprot:2430126-Pleurochrysis_carterae.AAC.2